MPASRHKTDREVQTIIERLRSVYGPKHPRARIEAYRYNSASIRVRIIDPDFTGKDMTDRQEEIWPIVEQLPEEVWSQLTMLLLLPPKNRQTLRDRVLSQEYDEPAPSRL